MTTDSDSNGRENQPRRGRDPNRDREGWLHLRRLPQGGHLNKHVPTVETEGPPWRTDSGRRSGTRPPRRPTTQGRSSRRRWLTWSTTRSSEPMHDRTCASVGGG